MNNSGATELADNKKLYVTIHGLPLSFKLEWPFRASGSGADWFVLHTDVCLETGEGRHALVSVNLTQVLREKLRSLEPADCEPQVINALRKETDVKQLEFVRSAKLVPLPFSSRHYDARREQWTFHHADEEQLRQFLRHKIYWEHKLSGDSSASAGKSWLTDPVELMYLGVTPQHMLAAARKVADEGRLQMEGEHAGATEKLLADSAEIESQMKLTLEELDKKHAFERAL